MIRVILVDDHHLVREGIKALLDKADEIEVVGEAEDGQTAIELVEQLTPDVVIMDLGMPRLNGAEATARITTLHPPTKVVILTMYSDDALVRETLLAGASGYVLKRSITQELLQAIRAAHRDEIYLSPIISKTLVEELKANYQAGQVESETGFTRLTPREREVLQLIAEGHTNQAIANLMGVSQKMVEKHRANLTTKLDVYDVAGLTRVAIKYGLVFVNNLRPPDHLQ